MMNELELTTRLLIVLGVLGLTVGPAAFGEVAEEAQCDGQRQPPNHLHD